MVKRMMVAAMLPVCCSGVAAGELPSFPSSEYLALYIPAKTPYTHVCGCARTECVGYNKSEFLAWDRQRPMQVQCSACKTTYPSDQFPESKFLDVNGERYEYHEDANGLQHHFSGCARYHRVLRALYDARAAARKCGERGDLEAGKQARDVLLAVAAAYPKWFYARTPTTASGKPPYFPSVPGEAGAGRLKQYFGDYGFPSFFCDIYEPLAKANLLSDAQRQQVRGLLEDCVGQCVFPYFKLYRLTGNTAGQIFTDLVRTAKAFPDLTIRDLVHQHHFKEERVLRGPDLVHEAVEGPYGIANLLANGFHADGFWREGSLSYQHMVLTGLLPCLRELRGYSDPPDYRPAQAGWQRLENFQPNRWAALQRALVSLPLLALPDGGILPLGDSHKKGRAVPEWRDALGDLTRPDGLGIPTDSAFHDGIGVASLRCGEGADATAAFLTYGPRGGGHSHYDQLSLTFCALGHELATDIGYPGSTDPLRQTWWNRAAAHNTVVVDGQNQAQSLGELEAFAVNPRFRLVQARCGNAYPLLQDYRRTLALIGDAPRCLVDVFHVVGGQTHDFCFHGQSEPELPQEKFVAEGVRLSPLPNPSATLLDLTPGAQPKTMGYDFVSALQRGTAPGPWQAEWRMGDERDVRLRLWRLPAEREEVFLGQASGHRVYPGLAKVDLGKKMNWLCCRSAGPAPWRSAFVSVVEAHAGETSQIRGVRRVAVQAPVECDAVAVVVEHADGSDLVVVSRAAGQVRVPDLGVELDGRIAAVSFDRARKPTHALLLDGAALTVGDVRVVAKSPSIAGKFAGLPQGVSEAPLVIDVEARVPDAALGAVLTLRHTNGTGSAWTVQKVEQGGPGRTRLWLDRSGREAVGLVGAIGEDGRTLLANSGFHQFEEQMRALFYNGAWLMVEGQQRRLESVALHGRGDPYLWEAKVSAPFNQPASLRGKPFIVTRVAEGDAFRIPSVTTWP